ncbi:MAG: flagellin [Rhodobacteraceae bacterium]|uniref:flagellin n=1 Tax=Albidovulum sp. TaxID=1872424 RepID=UPI001D7CD030|nr:flagellin [uncultured Defluviimonas sp.]MCB2124407.1 flagellin [Paracoccaceae bacterium]MCC0070606.1 flagellin [Paracoccaceae bacterium]
MSSILTNSSSMVALQTLKGINSNLSKTQDEISTGKSVASAKDNAAVWAISKVMEADVKGFKGISDSLALGESTVAVARQAAETVTDLLTEVKGKIVAAQEDNVDRAKIQTDIDALVDQINTVVGAAQFNGLNLVDGSQTTVDVLASLDRQSNGTVTTSSISITAQDLSTGGYTASNIFSASTAGTISTAGDTFVTTLDQAGGSDDLTIANGGTWAAGDKVSITIGDKTASYTVTSNDVLASSSTDDLVAVGLKNAIDSLGIANFSVDYDSANPGQLVFTNGGTADLSVTGQFRNAGSGGLGTLSTIDVSTASGAAAALTEIETLIQTGIDAAAEFGSAEKRIDIQNTFVGKLSDALRAGIGSMVDADMEEASARLQALQVQQQLGIQSLSIANQAPQNVLSLFR